MEFLRFLSSVVRSFGSSSSMAYKVGYQQGRSYGRYRQARFGGVGALLSVFGFVNARRAHQMHWSINMWSDEQIWAWRQAQMSVNTALVVASSIFASISVTALQLPNMDDIHWTARTLMTVSTSLSILSVMQATYLYTELSQLNDALTVRLWLSRGRPKVYDYLAYRRESAGVEEVAYAQLAPFDRFPLESSVSTLKSVSVPQTLLFLSALVFSVGFGLYMLFRWTYDIGGDGLAHRNNFITWLVCGGVCVIYLSTVDSFKGEDTDKREYDFDCYKAWMGGESALALRQLEERLRACQQDLSFRQGDAERGSGPLKESVMSRATEGREAAA